MPIALEYRVEALPLREPFHISGHRFTEVPALHLSVSDGTHAGRGEAAGVYYLQDRPVDMPPQIEAVRSEIEAGLDRRALRKMLPSGGARNALDCALWALESQREGRPVWQLAGLPGTRALVTTFTLGAEDPGEMARRARAYSEARALKLKLTGDAAADVERIRAVRAARPDAWLSVDANQGFSLATIGELLPVLVECDIGLLEQPFARGCEADMRDVRFPVPTAADESCQDLAELDSVAGCFDVVNIKLDKCGGLTEGLMMAAHARLLGLKVMIGNMGGTSLAMAPAFVLGQLADTVDLDGPTILTMDCIPAVRYTAGHIECGPEVWA